MKKILRQGRTLNLALATMFLGVALMLFHLGTAGIALMAVSSIVLAVVYHQSEIAFWRSQYEWWDDEEWQAWEEGRA